MGMRRTAAGVLGALAMALAIAPALAGCGRLGGEAFQQSFNTALPLAGDGTVGQTFAPAGSGVVGVDLLAVTYGEEARGTLTVDLRDGAGGPVLDSVTVDGGEIEDNRWLAVRFDEAVPTAGADGAAAVEARWDGVEPIGLNANVPRPAPSTAALPPDAGGTGGGTVAPLENDPYPGGRLLVDGAPAPGDLAFRVVGADGAAALPRTLDGIVGDALATLADGPGFARLWLALVAAAVVLAAAGLRRGSGVAGDASGGGASGGELAQRGADEQDGERQEGGGE